MLYRSDAEGNVSEDPAPLGTIGFVGLGHMGTAMAANLAAAGYAVNAYVRRAEQMKELHALGVVPTKNISDLFDAKIIISMLPDDHVVRDVFFADNGIAKRLAPGTIHLSMSTISTAASAEFETAHQHHGQGYVAAPVFGNPDAAKARQLSVIVAPFAKARQRSRGMESAESAAAFRSSSAARPSRSTAKRTAADPPQSRAPAKPPASGTSAGAWRWR